MPAYSHISTFIESLRTGKTNITRTLDRIFEEPERLRSHEHIADLRTPDFLDTDAARPRFPGWLRGMLMKEGMKPEEVDHCEKWPNSQKETVRAKAIEAIDQGRQMRFFWELHAAADPLSEITDPGSGEITVIFKSPREGVRTSSLIVVGEITVER